MSKRTRQCQEIGLILVPRAWSGSLIRVLPGTTVCRCGKKFFCRKHVEEILQRHAPS
jgi:hypothetical protein